MIYTLHPDAERDLDGAARFYRNEAGYGVAGRFLDEFVRVAQLLAEQPDLGTPTGDERRMFPLHGFPYTVIYRTHDAALRILVVRHQHRDPKYGQERG